MGSLLIVTGPPGSGKSTVAAQLAQGPGDDRRRPSALVSGDVFFEFLARGRIEPWLPESNAQNTVVTEAAGSATGRFVAGGFDTIYDGVVGPWFLTTFLRAADLSPPGEEGDGATVDYVILSPPEQACVDRVAARPDHGFTDETATRKMHAEFAAAVIDDRHRLDNAGLTVEETVATIRSRRAAGTLYVSGSSGQATPRS